MPPKKQEVQSAKIITQKKEITPKKETTPKEEITISDIPNMFDEKKEEKKEEKSEEKGKKKGVGGITSSPEEYLTEEQKKKIKEVTKELGLEDEPANILDIGTIVYYSNKKKDMLNNLDSYSNKKAEDEKKIEEELNKAFSSKVDDLTSVNKLHMNDAKKIGNNEVLMELYKQQELLKLKYPLFY